MPALSGEELTLLRDERHRFKEYLAVMQPDVVLACQLAGAPSGDPVIEISYDSVTEGHHSNVVPGMTLWVGTSAGGRQKGTCRIRKDATANTLYIAEDSAIDWEDDDHLTVVFNYEFWVKYPRIVVDGDITVYKDWEVAYSDQHSKWAPVAILGPPDCQFIDPTTGLATCKFVGEESYAVAPAATITGYSWTFNMGTPASSNDPGMVEAPIEVTWDTPGIHWVKLVVTDSNGKSHTGRRPVFIFPKTGAGMPYTQFRMNGRTADLNSHGHTVAFEDIYGDADQAEFPDGALVVYFTADWYGDIQQSIGGNFPYRSHIKFVGYIQRESTIKYPKTSVVTFEAATINALMASREGFSAWIKNKGSASTWCEATNLTADRAALSLARYNSTLLDIADVMISGNTLYIKSQEFAAKASLLQQLQTLYDDLFAHVACDKQGRVYFEPDPQMLPVADRGTIPIIADLQHGDWREHLDLPRPQEAKTSFINLGGVSYPGYPHAVIPILSKAPGDAPAYGGTTREINGLILANQEDGNLKAGLALAYDNNQFPEVSLPMAGLWDVFDIVPQEYVRLSLAAEDTKRGIVWIDQKLIPRRVSLDVEETEHGRVPRVTIQAEKDSYGPAGVDGDYPDEVPEPEWDLTPPPPLPSPPPGGEEGDGSLLYFVDAASGHLFRTRNARVANPADVVYEDLGYICTGLRYITLDSWNPKSAAMACGDDGIYLTENLNSNYPDWTRVMDLSASDRKACMPRSSICQKDLWMVAVLRYKNEVGWGWFPYVYMTENRGDDWTSKAVSAFGQNCGWFKLELSSHNANKAWGYYNRGDGVAAIVKTVDKWQNYTTAGMTGAHNPASQFFHGYHRFLENDDDNFALYGARNAARNSLVAWCTGDVAGCTTKTLYVGSVNGVRWVGGYTWGTNRYWALSWDNVNKFYVSDDALVWTLQYSFPGTTRFISGWPYLGERFYACQDGAVAPILISDDRGQTWQAQTGNWADLGYSGQIECCVPVWIK